jgi:hypothetical protein
VWHYLAAFLVLLLFVLIAVRDRAVLGQPFFLERLPPIP